MPANQAKPERRIRAALALEAEDATNAGMTGYMAHVVTQTTIPHSRVDDHQFQRSNGLVTVTISDIAGVGLPYGSYPRLLLAWISSEAVKTGDSLLEFGPTLSGFMAELGLLPTGGRWGTIHRLREQMVRLFSSSIACHYADRTADSGSQLLVAKDYNLWWDPKTPDQAALWGSTVRLSGDFFDSITAHPVLLSLPVLRVLKQSPMSLDIYCWLTYRHHTLQRKTSVPWEALQWQFGAGYPDSVDGLRDFKKRFKQAAERVRAVYPAARFTSDRTHLVLLPPLKKSARLSATH
ncbi:MAG: replication protein RepA [Gammaproteobacteria bacterium]|nr:replication protein RepA [Gammaproteobacteria bacterium]